MTPPTDPPCPATDARALGQEAVLRAAERFLADTSEAITPDTPAPALLRYAALYRSHLAALVATSRRLDRCGGRHGRT
jgi:hypothetical protein